MTALPLEPEQTAPAKPSALHFFELLFPEWPRGIYAEIRSFQDKEPRQDWVRSGAGIIALAKQLADTRDVYFSVNLRRDRDGTKKGVAIVNALHVEIDEDGAQQRLEAFEFPPTAIIASSADHRHAYFFFREPLIVESPADLARVEAVNRALAHNLSGDTGAWDASRVLRVPDTINHKRGDPVRLLTLEPGRRYDLSDFEDLGLSYPFEAAEPVAFRVNGDLDAGAILEAAHPLPSEVRELIIKGHADGDDRSCGDFRVCCDLCRAGLTNEEIRTVFQTFPVGEKYRQRGAGDRYLALTLGKARGEAGGNGAGPQQAGEGPCEKGSVPDVGFYFPSGFAAKRLAERLLDERPFAAGGGQLHVYRDGVYRADGDAFVRRRSAELLGDKWTRARADEAAAYLLATAPPLWERPPLDTVNVRNGLLDVSSGELRPHSADFLSCVQIGAAFHADAACPAIERFVEQVFPPDAVPLAYELAGHLMIPDTSPQRAVMLVGGGANGKTTEARTLETFLGGAANISAITLQALDSNRFAAAGLFGKLANIATDLDAEALKSSAMFKAIVSGDPITAERKYGAPFTFAPFARLLFSANEPPPTHDTSFAFFRRWIIIPFDQTFTGKAADPHLLDKLTTPAELSGLLNRALEGLLCLRERGAFTQTPSLAAAAEDFRQAVDSAAAFVSERCLLGLEHRVGQAALYDAYKSWCLAVGRSPLSARRFNQRVRPLLPDPQAVLPIVDGRPQWPGIAPWASPEGGTA